MPASSEYGYFSSTGYCYALEAPQVSEVETLGVVESLHIKIDCTHQTFACRNVYCFSEQNGWEGCTIDAEAPVLFDPFIWSEEASYEWDEGSFEGHFVAWDFEALRDEGTCVEGIAGNGLG